MYWRPLLTYETDFASASYTPREPSPLRNHVVLPALARTANYTNDIVLAALMLTRLSRNAHCGAARTPTGTPRPERRAKCTAPMPLRLALGHQHCAAAESEETATTQRAAAELVAFLDSGSTRYAPQLYATAARADRAAEHAVLHEAFLRRAVRKLVHNAPEVAVAGVRGAVLAERPRASIGVLTPRKPVRAPGCYLNAMRDALRHIEARNAPRAPDGPKKSSGGARAAGAEVLEMMGVKAKALLGLRSWGSGRWLDYKVMHGVRRAMLVSRLHAQRAGDCSKG